METAKYLFRFVSILVLLASLLSASGASAKTGTPVSGTQTTLFALTFDRIWTAGPWTQLRGYGGTGEFAFVGDGTSLSGAVTRMDNTKTDADGTGRLHGYITYVDENTGVICQGPTNGTLTNWALTASVNAHCSDGSTLHGNTQDTGVVFDGQGNVIGLTTSFSGTLFTPGR